MDTDGLRLFVLAAERLNISAAGRTLGMAPAVASSKLSKLERQVGADLLHRSTRKVSLSLEGSEFLPFAREILAQEDAGLAALGSGESEASGTLRFAASSTFAQSYIMPLIPDFMARHPSVRLDLRLSDTAFDLIEGSFDLALRSMALEDSSLKARKLADDTRILCASPRYLDAYGIPSTPSELVTHKLIAFGHKRSRDLTGPNGQMSPLEFSDENCRMIVDDGRSQKLATLAGAGISINSLWSVHEELKDGSLVRVLTDYKVDDSVGLWLVYPKSNVLTPKVRVFIDFLLQEIGKPPVWER